MTVALTSFIYVMCYKVNYTVYLTEQKLLYHYSLSEKTVCVLILIGVTFILIQTIHTPQQKNLGCNADPRFKLFFWYAYP